MLQTRSIHRAGTPCWLLAGTLLLAALTCAPPGWSQQSNVGVTVSNTAVVRVESPGGIVHSLHSNTDTFEIETAPPQATQASLQFYRSDESSDFQLTWAPYQSLDAYQGPTISSSDTSPAPFFDPKRSYITRASQMDSLRFGEPFFILLSDPDQNTNPYQADTVQIEISTGTDQETLILTENAPNSGQFATYLQPKAAAATQENGIIEFLRPETIVLTYQDENDSGDQLELDFEMESPSRLFDSSTGRTISGIAVTLIDVQTGAPAEVFGFDGVTPLPATVITGEPIRADGELHLELEDGEFHFPYVNPGDYRLQVELSDELGYTFPSSAEKALLESHSPNYRITPASRGDAFQQGSGPLSADLPIDPMSGNFLVKLSADRSNVSIGDFVEIQATISNRNALFELPETEVFFELPHGFRIVESSLKSENSDLRLTPSEQGEIRTVSIGTLNTSSSSEFSFLARVFHAPAGEVLTRATAQSGTQRSNEATIALRNEDPLLTTTALVIGQVLETQDGKNTGAGLANVAVYLETGDLALTDENGRFHFAGLRPGSHVVQVDTETLPEGSTIRAPEDRPSKKPHSRLIDIQAGALWRVDFHVETPAAAAEDSIATLEPSPESQDTASGSPSRSFGRDWLDQQPVDYSWLLPEQNALPPLPDIQVVVKHRPGFTVKAYLDGEELPGIHLDGISKSSDGRQAVIAWSGVDLSEGSHELEIVRTDSFGIERSREKRNIHYSSPPVEAELVSENSILVADGATIPQIAVRLFDKDGFPARRGVQGTYQVLPPYEAPRPESWELQRRPGMAAPQPRFVVGDDGIALLALRPTSQSGRARLKIQLSNREKEIEASLAGSREDWIVVGLAENTAAYRTLSGAMEAVPPNKDPEGFTEDGRIALFAKGRVKGEWLLTVAYDSEKQTDPSSTLQQAIDSDAYYTLFGDESQSQQAAPSSEKLYLKLERDAYELIYGTFDLGWKALSFTRFDSEIHGTKASYRGERLEATVFQSDDNARYAREELPAHGAAGEYQLKRTAIKPGSETVTVEIRDRIRPTIVLEERRLLRDIDYLFDFQRGSLQLNRPLFTTDDSLNPQYLIVQYETVDQTSGHTTAARVTYAANDSIDLGSTVVQREDDFGQRRLASLDFRAEIGHGLTAAAEVASSDNGEQSAQAYAASLQHRTERSDTSFQYRHTDTGFGLGTLNEDQLGTTQISIESRQQTNSGFSFRQAAFQDSEAASPKRREVVEADVQFANTNYNLSSGLRLIREKDENGQSQESLQATAEAARFALDKRLKLSLRREQNLESEAVTDFPTRSILGAEFALSENYLLKATQEWRDVTEGKSAFTRLGLEAEPWKGAEVLTLFSNGQTESDGASIENSISQSFSLDKQSEIEFGYEDARSLDALDENAREENTSAYAEYHYRTDKNTFDARIERFKSLDSRRLGLALSASREQSEELGYLAALIANKSEGLNSGDSLGDIDARLGIAWRPVENGLSVINRLDYKISDSESQDSDRSDRRIVNNTHINLLASERTQISGHLGLKYAKFAYDDQPFSTFSYFIGSEFRHEFASRFDLSLQASLLSGIDAPERYQYGLSFGRRMGEDMWLSIGYNFEGISDEDFVQSAYTREGLFVRFRFRFDQNSIQNMLRKAKQEP